MRKTLTNIAIAMCIAVLIVTVMVMAFVLNARAVPTESPAITPDTQVVWQTEYILNYEKRMGDVDLDEAEDLIADAGIICTYLGDGREHTLPLTWVYGTDSLGMSSDQAIVVIEEAIWAHCPEHTDLLKDGER